MKIKHAFLLGCIVVSAPTWAVNKCIGPDGKTVFQDAPCAGKGELVGEDVARRQAETDQRKAIAARKQEETDKAARSAALKDEAKLAQRQRVCKGKFYDEPAVGMTVDIWQNCTEFWNRHGSGPRVNETETAAGVRRQHGFEHSAIKYVYTVNGVITGIQR